MTASGVNNPFYGRHHSEESKRKISESKMGIRTREDYSVSDEIRAKISQTLKGRKMPNEIKRKISEGMKGKKNSIGNKNHLGFHHTEETKKKLAEHFKGQRPCDAAYENLCRGEFHWNWQGGIARLPYCPKFSLEFKEHIRDKFGRKCFLCPETERKRLLDVHHTDYNKNSICNGKEWPFVPLCRKCHAKTNYNRWYWFNLLIYYWAENPEIHFNAIELMVW